MTEPAQTRIRGSARVNAVVSDDVFDEFRDEPRLFEPDDKASEA